MRVFFLLLISSSLVHAVNCTRPENSAEKTICTHPDLKSKDDDIAQRTAALKSKLPADLAAILADTEMPYTRLRNDCSNEAEIPACLSKVLIERQDLLTRATTTPETIREALVQVHLIDIGFLWKYAPQLAGRKLSVYGCLILDDAAAPRIHATLETENQKSVPVLFKSMPEEIADFLDDQKPCAYWLVVVRKQTSELPLLYGDEVLGRPLP